jgi:regulatory protein
VGGTITALIVQKKNKERVNVYLDGQFAFGLAAAEAIKLRRGQSLSDQDIETLKTRDKVEIARQQVLGLLEHRPRSVEEIRRYLNRKEYPVEVVDQVIERLTDVGLLDDRAFARFWLENRLEFRPRGEHALRQELRQKGVPPDVIAELLTEHDESDAAYRAALPKAHRWRNLDALDFRKKIESFLIRRGFSYEAAREATVRAWQDVTDSSVDLD